MLDHRRLELFLGLSIDLEGIAFVRLRRFLCHL
jgi:hypothetical protein